MTGSKAYQELSDACRKGVLGELAMAYLRECEAGRVRSDAGEKEAGREAARSAQPPVGRFPNVAGFCRYLGVSISELDTVRREYPEAVERVLTILEDEALCNRGGVAISLLADYLKKRLDWGERSQGGEEVKVVFEHDIRRDGE